nr:LacI family DNA-binding transcriptional regulator [uncultured Dongia sp.]
MSVTVRDIAREAGVSIGTVSRALKNQPGLAEDTRRQIRAIASKLGYDSGKLQPRKVKKLAFLLHRQHNTLANTPFFSAVLHGVEEACRAEGIVPSFLSVGPMDPIADQLRLHDPDALLCAGFFEPELLQVFRATGKPIALIDLLADGFLSVNPDNQQGGYLATQHLLLQGRKRIAFLSGPLAHYSIRERFRGHRQALFDAGILADPALEAMTPPGMDVEPGAYLAMQQLLALKQRPDAVFAFNDSAALSAMRAVQEAGIRVPRDIAIVGFDDIAQTSLSHPPLTTLRIDKEELGRIGVDLLLHGPGDQGESRILPVELVVRESTVPAKHPAKTPAKVPA